MLFNTDPRKQEMFARLVSKVYLSRKLNQASPLPLDFNYNTVQTVEVLKGIDLSLDKKLDFNILVDNKINQWNKNNRHNETILIYNFA